jgi:DNA polymerase bacteriophage-type
MMRSGGLWRDLEAGVKSVIDNDREEVIGLCRWSIKDGDLLCLLPSGRSLIYHAARLEDRKTEWGQSKKTIVYEDFGKAKIVETYGGQLTENITQAIARDVFAASLVRLDEAGFDTVLHVHDEVVIETNDSNLMADIVQIMETPPKWARSLPLSVKASVSERYQ